MTTFVVGSALRTPLGNTAAQVVDALCAGRSAVVANNRFDASTYPCSIAATIATPPSATPHARFLRPIARHALDVANEAMQAAKLDDVSATRRGVFVGMGGLSPDWDDLMPAFCGQQPDGNQMWQRGLRRFHPFWMLKHLSNNAHALIAHELQLRGDGATFCGGNAGAQALTAAQAALHEGAIDAALVVAYDSLIEPGSLIDGAARGAFSTAPPEAFIAAYCPGATGACPGEAAAAMVLRLEPRADDRSSFSCVATHGADGEISTPLVHTVMRGFLQLANDELVVDGAALGMPPFDEAERSFVNARLSHARVTALQSASGQLGAAATPVQAIVLCERLSRDRIATAHEHQAASRSAIALAASAPGLAAAVRVCWTRK